MNKNNKEDFKKNIVNSFALVGYFMCFLQWLWVVLLYYSLIEKIGRVLYSDSSSSGEDSLLVPVRIINIGSSGGVSLPGLDFIMILVTFSIAAVVIVLTLYYLLKMPSTIVKTSEKIVHEAANKVLPLALRLQHKKDTKRNKVKITPKLIIIIKAFLLILALILTCLSKFVDNPYMDLNIAIIVGGILAGFCFCMYLLQYCFGWLLKISLNDHI